MKVSRKDGFTIVELLVVVVVIAILASITIVSYSGIQEKAKDVRRVTEVKSIQDALEFYYMDRGVYPPGCGSDAKDSTACSVWFLEEYLIPEYVGNMPQSDPNGLDYAYVRGDSRDSYGILVMYETKPVCKAGVRLGDFWGPSIPDC